MLTENERRLSCSKTSSIDGICAIWEHLPGSILFWVYVHVGHRPFSPLLPQLSHYVSSCDTFISASLPEVTWSPLSKIKFIKTSANVHMEIVWWFLKWIILQWFRICLLIYPVTIEIQHKLKNSFMRHLDYWKFAHGFQFEKRTMAADFPASSVRECMALSRIICY